jgi:hypothetical protein
LSFVGPDPDYMPWLCSIFHLQEVPPDVLARRRAANPREAPQTAKDDDNAAYD